MHGLDARRAAAEARRCYLRRHVTRDGVLVPVYRVKAGSRPVPVDLTDRLVQQGHALALWAGVVPETDLWR